MDTMKSIQTDIPVIHHTDTACWITLLTQLNEIVVAERWIQLSEIYKEEDLIINQEFNQQMPITVS